MSWDLTGKHVEAMYLGSIAISGVVSESRVAYGGRVKHTVKLDAPITVYGRGPRTSVIIEEHEINPGC